MQASPASPRAGIGGPKTLEGKLRSARNAVKHGLHSAAPVILEFETPEAWEDFKTSFVESLSPQTTAERHLAEEIALTMWRRRRISVYETRMANARMHVAHLNWEREARTLPSHATEEQLQQILYCTYTEAILPLVPEGEQLVRYEAHLGRQLTRLFRELHHLQKLRNCETNSPPPSKESQTVIPPLLEVPHPNLPAFQICSTNSSGTDDPSGSKSVFPSSDLEMVGRGQEVVPTASPSPWTSSPLADSLVETPEINQNCETNPLPSPEPAAADCVAAHHDPGTTPSAAVGARRAGWFRGESPVRKRKFIVIPQRSSIEQEPGEIPVIYSWRQLERLQRRSHETEVRTVPD